jgi:hypothetical protein
MDSSVFERLSRWLTPEQPLPIVRPVGHVSGLRAGFQLIVFRTDGLSRGLLQPHTREQSLECLSQRGFATARIQIDRSDIEALQLQNQSLLLTPRSSERWLDAAGLNAARAEFGFLYSPFVLVLEGRSLLSGWVVPESSSSPFPIPRLHAGFADGQIRLRLTLRSDTAVPRGQDALAALLSQIRAG